MRPPAAPYRCQELREDADRVLLGRAPQELRDRYHKHRRECTSCREFDRVMRTLYEGPHKPRPLSDQELEKGFQATLARARGDEAASNWMRPALWLAPIAAAAGILFSLGTPWPNAADVGDGSEAAVAVEEIVLEDDTQWGDATPGPRIPDRVGAVGHRAQLFGRVLGGDIALAGEHGEAAPPQGFRPGTSIETGSEAAQVALFGRILVNFEANARARWLRATHDLVELELHEGTLAVRYDRDDDDPILQVRTDDALVRVTGTVFTVETRAGVGTVVSVLRGHVEVLHPETGARIGEVEAGYRFDAARSTYADVGRAEVRAALPLADLGTVRGNDIAGSPIPSRWVVPGLSEDSAKRRLELVPDPSVSAEAAADADSVEQIAARGLRHPAKARRNRTNEAVEPSSPWAKLPPRPPVSTPAQDARALRNLEIHRSVERCRELYLDPETRYSAAACLERFERRYGDDPEAIEGLLLAGTLMMDFAQDYQAATLRFQEAIRKAPKHPAAETAMYKLTIIAIESGEISLGMSRGRAYLERYPNGRYVGHILQRFPELRDAI